jgi:hypothetical protein
LIDQPLGQLPENVVRPPKKALEDAMAELM